VKNLVLSRGVAPLVAPALQGESVIEVLPMLENLHLEGPKRLKCVKEEEAIRQFIAARQLSGHPVAVLDHELRQCQREREREREVEDEVSDR